MLATIAVSFSRPISGVHVRCAVVLSDTNTACQRAAIATLVHLASIKTAK